MKNISTKAEYRPIRVQSMNEIQNSKMEARKGYARKMAKTSGKRFF